MVDVVARRRAPLSILWQGARQRETLSPAYKGYMLFLFAIVAALAMMDRNILNILLVPIQNDTGASDTAMGLLTGTAFAVFYATAAIPISRLADTGNRRNLYAAAIAIWSAATALCGLAGSYFQLLLARIGVAAGEAAASPTAMSMIGDIFPPARRATAIGLMLVGISVGILVGSALGGLLNDLYGWRVAFFVLGIPGVLVAVIIWKTFPEPRRGVYDDGDKIDRHSESTGKVVRYLFSVPSFVALIGAKCALFMAFQGWLIWSPAFIMRVHDMSARDMGLWFGLTTALGSLFASLLGGIGSDYLARRGVKWYPLTCALATAPGLPLFTLVIFIDSKFIFFPMLIPLAILTGACTAPSIAAGLAIVRPRMRAFMTAMTYMTTNLVGAGVAPFLIGGLSDVLKPSLGDDSIRYAMLVVPFMCGLAAVLFYVTSLTIEKDARRALQSDDGPEPVPDRA